MDEEERKQAWQEYEDEKLDRRPQMNFMNMGMLGNMGMFPQPSFPELQSIRELIQKDVSNFTIKILSINLLLM